MTVAGDRVGRDGALRLRFERRGRRTVVAACRYTLPLQVLAPMALDDPSAIVSILNPTGGLVGGDRLAVEIAAGPAAHACLTTPSATKVYRTLGEPAIQEVRLELGAGATLEWVPDHTIPFAGAALRQTIDAEVAEGARLVLVDAFAAGRVARDEAWRFALLDSTLRLRDARGWVFADRFVLRGGNLGDWPRPGPTDGWPYFATVVCVGEGLERFAAEVARALPRGADARVAAAPLPRRGVVVRCLAASAPALTETVELIWGTARREFLGIPALALRKP
ncbi:MAG: urease accessory protein UreD [Candidatus Rokubacteria bacterium]|nr:urease accessory protein UreD [Candidatus Rokubacteria bacterium]